MMRYYTDTSFVIVVNSIIITDSSKMKSLSNIMFCIPTKNLKKKKVKSYKLPDWGRVLHNSMRLVSCFTEPIQPPGKNMADSFYFCTFAITIQPPSLPTVLLPLFSFIHS